MAKKKIKLDKGWKKKDLENEIKRKRANDVLEIEKLYLDNSHSKKLTKRQKELMKEFLNKDEKERINALLEQSNLGGKPVIPEYYEYGLPYINPNKKVKTTGQPYHDIYLSMKETDKEEAEKMSPSYLKIYDDLRSKIKIKSGKELKAEQKKEKAKKDDKEKETKTYEKEAHKAYLDRIKSEKSQKVKPSIYLKALTERRNLQDKNLKGYVDARIKAEKIMRITPGMEKLKGQKKELELMKMTKDLIKEEEEKPKGPVFKLSGVTRDKDKTTYDNAYSASMGLLGKGLRAGVRKIGEREDKAKIKLLIEKRKKTKPVEKMEKCTMKVQTYLLLEQLKKVTK